MLVWFKHCILLETHLELQVFLRFQVNLFVQGLPVLQVILGRLESAPAAWKSPLPLDLQG